MLSVTVIIFCFASASFSADETSHCKWSFIDTYFVCTTADFVSIIIIKTAQENQLVLNLNVNSQF